jgi:hypothetical protein
MDNYGPRQGIDGQIGGYSYQAEFDVCRELAITRLGRPDCVHDDHSDSVEDFERSIERGNPFAKTAAQQNAFQTKLRERRPRVKWVIENNDKIQAAADAVQLLCMFRPSMDVGLEFGDGMYLDLLMDRAALARRDFSDVQCICPMLL